MWIQFQIPASLPPKISVLCLAAVRCQADDDVSSPDTPAARAASLRRRCKGRSVFPGAFSSTKAMRPRGRSVSRSGAPSQPGEINFRQRPPCVFTADASLRSIRDSRICTPPRSLRPSAVKSWSGAKLVRGVLPLTYFAHSLTAFLAYLLDFYIRPIRAKCAAAKGGFSFKQVLRYLRQQRKNRPLSADVHHAFLCVVSSSSGRSCTTPLVTT